MAMNIRRDLPQANAAQGCFSRRGFGMSEHKPAAKALLVAQEHRV
jgi:hypothetical protein